MGVQSAKDLIVYQKAYKLAMHIFDISKKFPDEERYALTSQIRRSSRSVCLNLREAWLPARRGVNVLCICNREYQNKTKKRVGTGSLSSQSSNHKP
ncbi:four helix bundle protein [Desulfonatronovibrio magnus]|uniref:four helix bundle protein n=1 Tax=Desulfonatronovibrio magnus TaxID=698827 RepID=UPI000A056CE8|nr:four helix bundle protein [Desulfonatronovibrio magnus]